jgi:hypothetical protein
MKKVLFTLIVLFFAQSIFYLSVIEPYVSSWSATKEEIHDSLIGDDIAPYILSTRAINIDASVSEVWQVLISLGADREGFFAYTFLEELMGYKSQKQNKTVAYTMPVGRIVPTTINFEEKYHFEVVASKKEEYFVLKGWGSFVLRKISDTQTRLIIRTHAQNFSKIENSIFNGFHFIMERRMMLGIKEKAENDNDSLIYDILWFGTVVIWGVVIFLMTMMVKNRVQIFFIVVYGILFTCTLFIFSPLNLLGSVVLLMVLILNRILKQKGFDEYLSKKTAYS